MVIQQPLTLQNGRNDTVTNPCVIVEVLSKSTQDYDHGEKFTAYRIIENFREYILIDQYQIHVEHYLKTSQNQWLLPDYHHRDQSFWLQELSLKITLSDLYKNVRFE